MAVAAKVNEPIPGTDADMLMVSEPPWRNPLAEPVRDDFVETVKTSSEPEMAYQRASEWLRTPRISHEVGLYSELGRC